MRLRRMDEYKMRAILAPTQEDTQRERNKIHNSEHSSLSVRVHMVIIQEMLASSLAERGPYSQNEHQLQS